MTALWILLAAAAIFVVIVFAVYLKAFHSAKSQRNKPYKMPAGEQYLPYKEQTRQMVEVLEARPFESVSIVSHDGLRLVGQYYHCRDGAPLDIGVHGYRGTIERDFCGGSALSFAAGHHVLLVEQRAQGRSEGHAMTFGVIERQDCLAWIRYAVHRFGEDTKIVIYGVSMGATTVLMASGMDLPKQVCGIIADCPFSTPLAIIRKVARDRHLPPLLADLFAPIGARLYAGFDLRGASAVEAVKQAKVPILLIHGEDDRFVPCEMSREIAAAGGERISLNTFPQAGHGLSYLTDHPRYRRLVEDFWETVLV